MKLSCQRVLFLAAFTVTIGCHDTSAPPPTGAISYALTKINGRSLPTAFSPVPEAPIILWGSVYLDGSGHATISEHRREITGSESDFVTHYKYTVLGNSILFDYEQPCPPAAICAAPPTGTVNGSHLLLDFSSGQGTIIFDYQFFGLD